MKNEGTFGQHRQQGMMAVAPGPAGIVTLGGPFLVAGALEHSRIQVQVKSFRARGQLSQRPFPRWPPERLYGRLRETQEEVTDGIIAGEALHPQHRMECMIGAQPLRVSKATSSRNYRGKERRKNVSQWKGVIGGRFCEWQCCL